MPELKVAPPTYKGYLLKQSPNRMRSFIGLGFQRRHFVIQGGQLSWSEKDGSTELGSIDFGQTSCMLEPVEGSDDQFVLRPAGRSNWSENDEHTGSGTNRRFLLDVRGCGLSREEWMMQISEHIQFGESLSTDSHPLLPLAGLTLNLKPLTENQTQMKGPRVVFVLGGPGSGKGTQCARVAEKLGYSHLSAGDLLRSERQREGSEYGELIETHIREGKIVPAEITVKLLQKAMKDAGWDGGKYLIDGFPRNLDNLEAWERGIGHTASLQFVLFLECTEKCMESRLLERGKTSGRSDDNAETIKKRFTTFQYESMPVVEAYETQGLLRRVDATLELEAVWQKVEKVFGPDVVFVLGGPGSGKGTQCQRISAMCGYKHLSAGDLLREERQRLGSATGELIEKHILEGKIVPAEITVQLLEKAMRELGWERGRFLVDGFPRNMDNLETWEKMMSSKITLKFVLFFECSEECMEGRLLERGKTSGRSDDNIESIRKRFRTFKNDSMPVALKFEDLGLLRRVNAEASVEEVWANVQLLFAPSVVFVLGSPGSGKSTICKRLTAEFGFIHLNIRDLLQAERKRPGSQHAQTIEKLLVAGDEPVPNHIVVELMMQAMERSCWEGGRYLLEDFPGNSKDLECWLSICGGRVGVKFGLLLDCSETCTTERLLKKGESNGWRPTPANLETIKFGSRTFQLESVPVVSALEAQGLIRRVDGEQSFEEVWADVEGHFGPEVVFILGGPGSGKGTQCERVSRTFSYRHLIAGDLLRDESERPTTEVGKLIQKHIRDGTIVPAEITVKLLLQAMKKSGWDGGKFLIDGFPRSLDNLKAWETVTGKKVRVRFCLFFECSEACMEARILERGKTSGRSDDNLETIKKRFRTFIEDSMPVVERFESQGMVQRINAETSIAEVWRSVRSLFGPTVVFALGSPGSSKSTQCRQVAKAFRYTHLSAGDLLKEEQNRPGSEFGDVIKARMSEGQLVPQEITVTLLVRTMEKGGWAGGRYLINGFPRSMDNLQCWRRNVGESAYQSCCIFFYSSEEVMKARRKTAGRVDDDIDSLRKFFVTFYNESMPVIDTFRAEGRLQHINADRTTDEVWRDVQGLFGPSVICILGEHIAGKSEDCRKLAESCRYKYLCTSDLLAAYSEEVAALQKEGKPVPSELVVGLIRRAMLLGGWEKGKYMLDGFPRSVENLKVWKQIMGDTVAFKLTVVIKSKQESLEAKRLKRLHGGADVEDTVKKSIKNQVEEKSRELEAVVEMLAREGLLRTINGEKPVEQVWSSAANLIAPTVIFVLGGPGTGKGTQCEKIANSFGFHHLSAGDLLREERKRPGSELAELIESHIREGKIVPAEITVSLLSQAMEERGWEFGRYLVDGFPRSLDNLACWQNQVGSRTDLRCVLFFECSEKVMEERLLERGKTSGRSDDNLESIQKRFQTFQEQSVPVIQKFEPEGLLRRVSAEQGVSEVWTCVQEVLRNEVEGNVRNQAIMIVKPHANKRAHIVRFVTSTLISKNIRVLDTGKCSAEDLEEKGLFKEMYFQIVNYADADPKQLTIPAQGLSRFQEAFKESWADAVKGDKVENAFSAAVRLGKGSKEMLQAWNEGEVVRIAPKLHVGRLTAGDTQIYVLNGFALHLRETFITGVGLTWLLVEFDPANLSYKQFRSNVLGVTNPAEASRESLRGELYANWNDLGLDEQPTTLDNCIHASAGPLEALREIMLWKDVRIDEDATGRMLMSSGVPQATLESWLQNPHVQSWPVSNDSIGDDVFSGPIFDATEGCDTGAMRDSAVAYLKAGPGLKSWTLSLQEDTRGQPAIEQTPVSKKPESNPNEGPDRITILHFNDVYNVEPRKQEPVGGIARFVTRVRQLKQEAVARGEPEAFVLFSGDAFNPSLTSTVTKGEHMVPALNAVGIHTAVYGNHDFDWGIDQLVQMAKASNYPWLISNVIDKSTGRALADGLISRVVDMAGHKVGLIGLVEQEWLVTLATIEPEDVDYEDFCVCGKRLATELKKNGAEIVIALTHMRVPNDELLASTVPEVDVILGGHDHHYDVKPVGPHGTYVLKSGTDFRDITVLRLEFVASKQKRFKVIETSHEEITASIPEDPDMKKFTDECQAKVGAAMDEIIGESAVELDSRFSSVRTMETNIGNFVVDVMRKSMKADVAMLNSGTLRADAIIETGAFRMRDLVNLLPMLDEMCKLELSGQQVLEALENSVSQYPRLEGRFAQVSGVKFTFDAAKTGGSRVVEASVFIGETPLDLKKKYTVATKDYLRQGKDGYDVFKGVVCLCDGEQAGMIQTTVRDHFLQVSHLNGETGNEPRRTKRASMIAPDLAKVGTGPESMKRYAIEPKVEGRIVCLNPVQT